MKRYWVLFFSMLFIGGENLFGNDGVIKITADTSLESLQEIKKKLEGAIEQLGEELRQTAELDKRSTLIAQWNKSHIGVRRIDRMIQKMQQASQVSKDQAFVETGIKRASPLALLSQLPGDKWLLSNPSLELQLKLALQDSEIMATVLEMRKSEMKKWDEWQSALLRTHAVADKAYRALREAMILQVKDRLLKKISGAGSIAPAVAEIVIKTDIHNKAFVSDMIAHISGRGGSAQLKALEHYKYLFLMILGYDFESSEFHKEVLVHAPRGGSEKRISDASCMHQVMAHFLVMYRKLYDQHYQSALVEAEDTFVRHNAQTHSEDQIHQWIKQWQAQRYSSFQEVGELPSEEERSLYGKWQSVLKKVMAQSHRSAAQQLDGKLHDIWYAMCALHARLDLLRVPLADFHYLDGTLSLQEHLTPAHAYSVLIGMLLQAVEIAFVDEQALNATKLQRIFTHVMTDEYESKHIREMLPPGGEENKHASAAQNRELRQSYEACMYTIVGTAMDVFLGIGEQENRGVFSRGATYEQVPLAEALTQFKNTVNVQSSVLTYLDVVKCYGEANALLWRIPRTMDVQMLEARLKELNSAIEEHLESIDISVVQLQKNPGEIYREIVKNLVLWERSAISFAKPLSLREQLRDRSPEEQMRAFRATYQLLWLYVWRRLHTVLESGVHTDKGGKERLLTSDALIAPDVIDPVSLRPVTTKVAKKSNQNGLSEHLGAVKKDISELPKQVSQVVRSLSTQVGSLKSELANRFSKSGDLSGVVEHVNSILGQVNSILPGFDVVLGKFRDHGRHLNAGFHRQFTMLLDIVDKLMECVLYLRKAVTNKTTAIQRMLSELLNSPAVRFAAKAGTTLLGGKLRKALEQVSQEDEHIQRKLRESFDNLSQSMDEMSRAWSAAE